MKKINVNGNQLINLNEMINHYKNQFKDRKDCPQFLYALHKTSRIFEQKISHLRKEYNRMYWELIKVKKLPNDFDGHLFEKEFESAVLKIEETLQVDYDAFVLENSKKKKKKTEENGVIEIEAFKVLKVESVKTELSEKYAAELEFGKELNEKFKTILDETISLEVHSIVDESYIPAGLDLEDIGSLEIIFDI